MVMECDVWVGVAHVLVRGDFWVIEDNLPVDIAHFGWTTLYLAFYGLLSLYLLAYMIMFVVGYFDRW